MSPRTKLIIGGVVNFALLVNPILAQLPPISFESPTYVTWDPIDSYDATNWHVQAGEAKIGAAGSGYGGGQSLVLPQNSQEAWLRRDITWNATEQTAFIDFKIKPAADPEGSLANFVSNGSQLAFQVSSSSGTGQLWAFSGGDGGGSAAQQHHAGVGEQSSQAVEDPESQHQQHFEDRTCPPRKGLRRRERRCRGHSTSLVHVPSPWDPGTTRNQHQGLLRYFPDP